MNFESQVRKYRCVDRDQIAVAIDANQISRVVWIVIDVMSAMRSPSLSRSRECQTSQSRRTNALLASDICSAELIELPKRVLSKSLDPTLSENNRF